MPIYAYKCAACGYEQDVLQKIADAPLTVCPQCGKAEFSKQVTAAGFQLKGSGWYVTDFRGGSKGGDTKNGDTKAKGGDTQGNDAKGGDSKAGDGKSGDAKSAGSATGTTSSPATTTASGSSSPGSSSTSS